MMPLFILTLLCIPSTAAFSNTCKFNFPNVPIDLGIRHIHTPESFALSHKLTMPEFQLLDVSKPWAHGNYAVITFSFKTLLGTSHARMFTNDRCTSYILFSNYEHMPSSKVLTTLRVQREGTFGHQLQVESMCIDEVRNIIPMSMHHILGFGTPLFTKSTIADAIREGYAVKDENPNLLAYRRMVLFGEGRVAVE